MNAENYEKMNTLLKPYNNLMPASGKCDTVGGEIIRALNRIIYRYFNDGDVMGIGYGRETVNPAVRYLLENFDNSLMPSNMRWYLNLNYSDYEFSNTERDEYELLLTKMVENYIPIVELKKETPNSIDMWDCATDVDVDIQDEEDDEDWCDEDIYGCDEEETEEY